MNAYQHYGSEFSYFVFRRNFDMFQPIFCNFFAEIHYSKFAERW